MASPTFHARLSPSGAKRWLHCTMAPTMEDGIKDTGSVYAAEGTAAHSLAELKLQYETGKITKRTFTVRHNKFKAMNEFYNPSMDDYVDEYVGIVMERFNALPNASIDLEVRVDYSDWVPDGTGTSDVVIAADGVIEVIDLKYGTGVPVSAEWNEQAMLYGLGAFHEYDMIYDFQEVRMTIVQPRLGSVSTFVMTIEELLAWANDFVEPQAAKAASGEGEFDPSPDTCQWCKAKAFCKARAEKNLEIAAYEFADPNILTPVEMADILAKAKEITSWIKDVEDFALTNVRDHDLAIPGWKLVEGRSNRVISDPDGVILMLEAEGFEDGDIMKPPVLQTITALEKVVGKKRFAELVGEFIVKPEGKPVLVPETDKRPELNSLASATDDFGGVGDD